MVLCKRACVSCRCFLQVCHISNVYQRVSHHQVQASSGLILHILQRAAAAAAARQIVLVRGVPCADQQPPKEVCAVLCVSILLVRSCAEECGCLADAEDAAFVDGLDAAEGCDFEGGAVLDD
jgi:hypothetical protein